MPADIHLVPVEVEDLLADIREALSRDSLEKSPKSAVRYYPAALNEEGIGVPPEAAFDEEQYFSENPDVAQAVQRGDFQSGYDHWVRAGMHEGRKFPDSEVDRPQILGLISRLRALNRDVHERARELGSIPPYPETLRGRFGALLVSVLRRATQWYTHSLRLVMESIDKRSREEAVLFTALANALEQNRTAVTALQTAIAEDREAARARAQQLESQIRQAASEVKILSGSQHVSDCDIAAVSARLDEALRQMTRLEHDLQSSRVGKDALDLLAGLQGSYGGIEQRIEEVTAEQERLKLATSDLRAQLTQVREAAARAEESGTVHLGLEMGAREALARKVEEIASSLQTLQAHLGDISLYSHETRAEVAIQQRRVSMILEELRSQSPATSDEPPAALKADHLDGLYLSLENAFRGPRETIRQRQNVYLPYVRACGAGTAERPVLDLGCGRGEWLEVLRDNGFTGRGVDGNVRMVELCRSLGLEVVHANSLTYLSALPDSSIGAATSFHMVEHLPFSSVIALLDECLRVLKSGGLLILETPNPDNVLVGSTTFHLDPTHVKPLPSQLLQFFVEARGFCASEILKLHPYPDAVKIPEEGNCTAKLLNQYLYGPQDYAILARRP